MDKGEIQNMNLLEHYIKEVYSEKDITKEFEEKVGRKPVDPMVEVKMRVDCYGRVEDTTQIFFLPKWQEAQQKGYYMA